jgi:hypothetical protein
MDMIKQILSGYQKLFVGIAKIMALLAFCLLTALVLVWPLWYFAVTYSIMYTRALLILLLVGVIVFAMRKKRLFLKVLVLALGTGGFVWAIIAGAKLLAVFLALLTLCIYGILAYGTKKTNAV